MGLFDKDDYDDVNLESLDGLAYDELNQKLHEYNKAMANEDKDIIEAKKEKKKKKALFKTNAEKTGGKFCISFVCVTGIKFKNCIYYSQKRR